MPTTHKNLDPAALGHPMIGRAGALAHDVDTSPYKTGSKSLQHLSKALHAYQSHPGPDTHRNLKAANDNLGRRMRTLIAEGEAPPEKLYFMRLISGQVSSLLHAS